MDTPPINFGYENVASNLAAQKGVLPAAEEEIVSFNDVPPTEGGSPVLGTVMSSVMFAANSIAECWKKRSKILK